ncbi:MAG: hypothetical protein ACOYOS_15125, partial [Syntrophales bacterium]
MTRIIITLLTFIALVAGDLGGLVATARAAEPPTTPILQIETGMHSAVINRIATDSSGRWLVTASDDKSLRVWDLNENLQPVRIIRPPIGEGNEGKLYSVALSPDGSTIACGGWTQFNSGQSNVGSDGFTIYLFNRASGNLTARITGLPNVINHLVFSPDGRYLAATMGVNTGIRLYSAGAQQGSSASPIFNGHSGKGEADTTLASPLLSGEDKEYGGASYSAHFSRDGRLLTTSYDGFLRLYETVGGRLRLVTKVKVSGGSEPIAARFSPDGSRISVGYNDTANVSVLSGRDLSLLFSPDISGVTNGNLGSVDWSADGRFLFAGGMYQKQFDGVQKFPIRRWSENGRGSFSDTAAADNTIMDLAPLPDGRVAIGSTDPAFGLLDQAGKLSLFAPPSIADYRDSQEKFFISGDGATVRFGYEWPGNSPATFDLGARNLNFLNLSLSVGKLAPSDTTSLPISNWKYTTAPKLNNVPLKLEQYEMSRSLAIASDGGSFILGTEWYLRRFDRQGKQIWAVPAPGITWAVNISGNGSVVIAAYGDGTIRWHRMSDGKELIAFFPHADKKRWVLWTPEGFFDHSPGGEELIGFHLNRGKEKAAEFIPVARLYKDFYRPDLVTASFEGKDISEYAKAVDINKLLTANSLPPKVRILTQASSTDKPETELSAEICDNGGGIGDVTLYLNNMPIAVQSGGRGLKVVGKGREVQCYSFSRTLTLDNGDNVISIMAYNKENNIESERPDVIIKHTSRFTGKPNLHILTIAIDKYRDGDLQLKYSRADADGVADLLNSKGKGLFGTITRHTLSDGDVTKEKLEETFAAIGKKIRREDM